MTWIVGTVPPFGYSILVSDIRVTWSDGTERDCLQKVHKVGEDFLCGFAGSVKIGFALLDALATQLPRKQQQIPSPILADDWIPSLARRVFQAAPELERKSGCQLIVAAAHPTENCGDINFPRTYVWIFSHPNFNPQKCGPQDAIGIGNGSIVSSYVTALQTARRDIFFLKLITHSEGAQAQHLARTMRESVIQTATRGVSSFMQMGIVTRGRALFDNYNYTRFQADGTTTRVQVPIVAQTYRAFCEYCKTDKLNATAVIC